MWAGSNRRHGLDALALIAVAATLCGCLGTVGTVDTTAPVISAGLPTGTLPSGTTTGTLMAVPARVDPARPHAPRRAGRGVARRK